MSNKWICELLGNMEDNAVKEFDTKEQAISEMKLIEERLLEPMVSITAEDETSFELSDCNDGYQACFVYEKPQTMKEELLLELDRAYYGLTQYAFELVDSYTCGSHLSRLRELIEKM